MSARIVLPLLLMSLLLVPCIQPVVAVRPAEAAWPWGDRAANLPPPQGVADVPASLADVTQPAHTGPAVQSSDVITSTTPFSPRIHMSNEIVVSAIDNQQLLPAVAYNRLHDEYLIVWHNTWPGGHRDIYAQRLTGQGDLRSWFAVSAGPNDRAQPSVAYDPDQDRYLVVWINDVFGDGSDWDVRGKFVPWNGPPEPTEFTICDWNSSQWNPVVVYNQHPNWPEFLVVWTSTPAVVPAYVSARRVFADGSGFPPGDGFTVSSHSSQNRVHPDVAYNLARNEYVVVLGSAVDIYGVRLSAQGQVLGGGEFDIAGWPDSEEYPAVAASAARDQYLVVWQSLVGPSTGNYALYGRFVTGDASSQGAPFVIDDTTSPERHAQVACNSGAGHYLVAYEQRYTNLQYGVTARFISVDGAMPPAFPITAPLTGDRTEPAVASGPPGFLVAWEHDRSVGGHQDIHARVVWPDGAFLPVVMR